MTLLGFSAKNAFRNRFRLSATVLGVAVAVLAFVLLRTVVWAYTVGLEAGAKDRIITRHKVTFVMSLPKNYVDQVAAVPGVTGATWANWFGGKDPKHENEFFSTLAVDDKTYFDVMDEMSVPAANLAAWKEDRQGAIVGDQLAKKMGWKVGDKVALKSQIFAGDWEFHVSGIYAATKQSVDRSTLVFHWRYFNEGIPERMRDKVGWIIARVKDPARTAEIGKDIDRVFDEKDTQTLSQSERAFNMGFLGFFSAVLKAIDVVSFVIVVIMMLILGNTIAMGVRERTGEYGTLRAIGFRPLHLAIFVFGESLVTGVLGGLVGLAIAYPLVDRGVGRFIEENLGGIFPYFRVTVGTAGSALALAVALALVAAIVPAISASRLKVVDALRRVA